MGNFKLRKRCRKCIYFAILAITVLPIFIFPLSSRYIHRIYNSPQIEQGVLDLEGYDFSEGEELPLDGEWEFYWQKWLITDQLQLQTPDLMLNVPEQWNWYVLNGKRLPEHGYASYRITIKNAPLNVNLTSVIPDLAASYRVFINGELVTSSGRISKTPNELDVTLEQRFEWLGHRTEPEQELVIEVSSSHNGGLYMVPVLMGDRTGYMKFRLRYVFITVALGIILATITAYICVLSSKDVTFHSVALLILDILVLIRILLRNQLFCILKEFLPFINYHRVNSLLQIVTLFLPVAFLLSAKDLVGTPIKKREIQAIMLYETICCIPMYFCFLNGMLMLQYLFCMIGTLPYIIIMYRLYQRIKEGIPYSGVVSAGMLLTISSLIIANQYATGMLYRNASLYPVCYFMLAVGLQVLIYIRRNNEIHEDALEAANLRLKLQEAETSLMLSQIKPHFLYNALIAIQVLCTREPETAEDAILHFAKYLRMNMSSINSKEPIPFSQELEHIRNYAAIEKLRFKERLNIKYDIEEEDFKVPPLTIQPLVENAIKHGVCKAVMGGTVLLHTYRTQEYDCVEISDDGPGFDPEILKQEKTGSYGLKNITFRLKNVMKAEIKIESELNKGTCVLVRLPREKEK